MRLPQLLSAASLALLQACATQTRPSQAAHAAAVAPDTPAGAVFNDVPETSAVVNGVMHDLAARSQAQESVKGARVNCMITIDGHVGDCGDVTPNGPNAFSVAFVQALQRPEVQFQPMTLNGSAVSGRHVFAIEIRARRARINGVPAAS